MGIRTSSTRARPATRRLRDAEAPARTTAKVGERSAGGTKKPDAAADRFDPSSSAGLAPFSEHYPAATTIPKLPKGKPTLDTFDEDQVRALHRAYWSAPATASLADMAKLAFRDPAFRGRKLDDASERQIGRLLAKLPESFPWGWRSRALAATSHVLVDALVRAPAGTSVTSVVDELQRRDKDFPGTTTFSRVASEGWVDEPERFPFVARALELDDKGKSYRLEARGKAAGVRKDGYGRYAITEPLAKKVAELATSNAVDYGWTLDDFAAFVDTELGGDGAFTRSTFESLREKHGDLVPGFNEVRVLVRERVARAIHDLFTNEGVTTATGMIEALHERMGTPLWKTSMLTYLRELHPDLVPDFKAAKASDAYADARRLLDAVLAQPDTPRAQVGRELGFSDKRIKELLHLAGKRWPDELETATRTPFSAADVRMLRQAIADAPLNATMRDLMRILATEHGEFLERHPYATPESLYASAVMPHGGLRGTWHEEQQQRYVSLLVDAVKRSPPTSTLTEIVNVILDEHEGAYSLSNVKKLVAAARAKDPPPALVELAALLDKSGAFPWERSQLKLTKALARRVGDEIEKRPDAKLIDVVRALRRDKEFAKEHPAFTVDSVHHLRARYPSLVPYVDAIGIGPNERRVDVQRRALAKIAKTVAAKANQADDPSGLTIAGLARAVRTKPHRVLAAIRQQPELFPWYKERPVGRIDLYLATRVAHAVEQAPLGTTLEQVVDELIADKKFRRRYPAFNYHTVSRLRERYPEIVPGVHARNQVLRSKILSDAIVAAKKGTKFDDIFAAVSKAHPGAFPENMADEGYLKALWASDPTRFPFVDVLRSRAGGISLTGRGERTKKPSAENNEALATKLAKLEVVPENLTVLDKLVEGVKGKPFADTEVLAIQHLLGPQVAMFDAARKLGMTPDRSSIVGIPYSVSETVVSTLEDKGFDVRVPPLDLEAWYDLVAEAMEDRIEAALKSGRKIVVFDDGGLVPMMFERHPHLAEHAHLFRIVEQTTRGITVADGVDLYTPVVNVAQSWAKFVEGPMVGSTVQKKLLTRLAGIGVDGVKGKHVGVTGFGTIGAPLAQFLKDQGAIVTVCDVGPEALKRARAAGFDVVDGRDEKARAKFFGKQDILVGATGHRSMTADDIEQLKDGAVLGSCSSKLVEIDVDTLKELSKRGRIEVVDAESFPPAVRYHFKDGRSIDLLASGFPMNFDGGVEDVAAERIQLTMGLMLAGALQAAGVSAAGLHRLDPSIQLELLRAFHDDVGERLGGDAVAGAMSVASAHLRELEKKHGAREHDLRHR